MEMFSVCRVEDFHLWYGSANDGFFMAVIILAFLAIGTNCLIFCKKMSEDLIKRVQCHGNSETEGGDNWPSIQPDISGFEECGSFTYADFEKRCAQISPKEKELCKQK